MFQEDRKNREEKIAYFQKHLKEENESLSKAKRDRQQYEATKNRIVNELKRLKIKKYYELPILTPITVQKKLQKEITKSIASFKVDIKKKKDVMKSEKLLDGVCVFVTNHTELQGRGFKMKPQRIIKAY